MGNEEIRKIVHGICKKNSIDESLFYIANICNSKNIIYDFRNKKEKIKEKFIIRYFAKYDMFVVWNREDHKPQTKKLTLSKKDFNKSIDTKTNVVKKGVEFKWRKLTTAYVSDLKDLEKIILECTK